MFPYKNTKSTLLTTNAKKIYQIYKTLFNSTNNNLPLKLSTINNIFLTYSNMKNKNFLFKTQITQKNLKTILKKNTKTIKNYHNTKILKNILNNNKSINTPFLKSIINILYHNKNIKKLTNFIKEYN